MTAVPASVPSAVPSAVNTVSVLNEPQAGTRKFYQSGGGTERIPVVPRTEVESEADTPPNPRMGHLGGTAGTPASGSGGSPSVPVDGFLFKRGPIDAHYTSEYNPVDPYRRVNNPPTRGMFTFILQYLNHVAHSQNVDEAGWKQNSSQQRTSVMRVTPPAHGIGYVPATYTPQQMPQQPNTYKVIKATGTQPYGTGVLNTDTLGAGQVAGGIGGNQYTPQPGPPATTSTAGNPPQASGMPTWG